MKLQTDYKSGANSNSHLANPRSLYQNISQRIYQQLDGYKDQKKALQKQLTKSNQKTMQELLSKKHSMELLQWKQQEYQKQQKDILDRAFGNLATIQSKVKARALRK